MTLMPPMADAAIQGQTLHSMMRAELEFVESNSQV
jgi:hypothetical protein